MDLAELLNLLRDLEWEGGGMTHRCLKCRVHRYNDHLPSCQIGYGDRGARIGAEY